MCAEDFHINQPDLEIEGSHFECGKDCDMCSANEKDCRWVFGVVGFKTV
jgi:hypothetical protein